MSNIASKLSKLMAGTGLIDITMPGLDDLTTTTARLYAGNGYITDFSDPDNPTIVEITWAQQDFTDSYVATALRTWIGVDDTGTVVQFNEEPTSAQRRANIIVGVLTHTDGATITQVNLLPITIVGMADNFHDACNALGFINLEGNVYAGENSSTNELEVTAGKSYGCSRNYSTDQDDPNVTSQAADSPISNFFTGYRDGSGGATIGSASVVDSTKYDDGTGTLATLPDGYWVTHRLYRSTVSGSTLLVYGQDIHKGRSEAISKISTEQFDVPPGTEELLLRGFLTIRKNAAGLQDTSTSIFTPADRFGVHPANPESNGYSIAIPSMKSFSITSTGIGAGSYYLAGFYQASATDANLTQAATTVTYGSANASYAAHGFIVAGGAGTVDTGQVGLRANFTSITDDGVRTTLDTETITDDITTLSTDQFVEVVKKCLGQIEFELYVVFGSPTTYSLDFNYGIAKYDDFGNRNFMVTDFEVTLLAGANDANFEVELLKHSPEGWTYAATGFVPGGNAVCQLTTDHSTDDQLFNGQYAAYKRADLDAPIEGADDEGVIIRVTQASAGSMQSLNAHIGVEF